MLRSSKNGEVKLSLDCGHDYDNLMENQAYIL